MFTLSLLKEYMYIIQSVPKQALDSNAPATLPAVFLSNSAWVARSQARSRDLRYQQVRKLVHLLRLLHPPTFCSEESTAVLSSEQKVEEDG